MVRASRRKLAPRVFVRTLNPWLSSGCFLLVVGLLAWWWFVAAAIFVGCAVLARVLHWREKRRHLAVAAQRADESICTFARGFDCRCTDTLVIRAVYDELQPLLGFPLRATDHLETDLRLDGEDLELDIAPMVAGRTGRSLKIIGDNPYFGKIKTVADLVGFFCQQPSQAAAR